MKSIQEIKTALEDGKPVFEGAAFPGLKVTKLEWTVNGCKWHYEDGSIGNISKTFVDEAMNPEYLSYHLFSRQNMFGPVTI